MSILPVILAPIILIQSTRPPAVVDLDASGFTDMRQFDGRPVVAPVTAATLLYTWWADGDLVTAVGPGRDEGAPKSGNAELL